MPTSLSVECGHLVRDPFSVALRNVWLILWELSDSTYATTGFISAFAKAASLNSPML